MARQRYDICSHWMLHNQGKGALLVGGLKGVRRIEPGPGEIAQTRKFPDSLLRVYFTGERKPHYVLVEVATYPEQRALTRALDDLALSYAALGYLPELLMLILAPKGSLRIGGQHEVRSKLGLSRLAATWKPVELWTLSAESFLAEGAVDVVPWVPLMHFEGPPETLLEQCAEKIEREALPQDRANLLGVTQVLGTLKFPEPLLAAIMGGTIPMFELPIFTRFAAERSHKGILALLTARFGTVPPEVGKRLRTILNEDRLIALTVLAGQCPDLKTFSEALHRPRRKSGGTV